MASACFGAASAVAVAAQTPVLMRDLPIAAGPGCSADGGQPRHEPASAFQRQQAERLAAEATQAALLGDNATALALLQRAADLDPSSTDIAYRLGRTYQELGRFAEAVDRYCRYLAMAEQGSELPDSDDVRDRIAALTARGDVRPGAAPVTQEAAAAFTRGLAQYDAGRLPEAETAFGTAIRLAPEWPAPLFNRAIVRLARGRHADAARDLRTFLEMSPGSSRFSEALDILAGIRQQPAADTPLPYNPGSAFAAGLLLPGLGQFTTGRTGTGTLVLAAAAGAVAAGVLITRTEVDCLSPPVLGECPPEDVLRERLTRPYLAPAAGTAAAIALFGAFDAWRGARARNQRALLRERSGNAGRDPIRLAAPGLHADHGTIDLRFFGIRF